MPKKIPFPKLVLDSVPMDWRYVDYDYLSYKCQQVGIKTFRQYRAFITQYHPAGFPGQPERTYPDQWTTWNDFLHTDNCYLADHPIAVRKRDRLPFWEAVNIIQPFKFSKKTEFLKAFDEGLIPKGISRRPDRAYVDFAKNGGWVVFLGKTPTGITTAAKNTVPLLAICTTEGQSENVLTILISKQGPSELLQKLREFPRFKVVRTFKWEPELGENVLNILNYCGNQRSENSWIFSNVNNIMFELTSLLETYDLKT